MRNPIFNTYSFLVYLIVSPFFLISAVINNSSAQEINEFKDSTPNVINETYVYAVEGRTDPFKPFISKKATTSAGRDANEIIDEKTELTGMQLFEPGQLTLVGILTSGKNELALVEDQTKKGYFLKRGNLIGRRGIVTEIDKQQVVITEIAHTRAGKEISSTVTMRLKKEGDK